MKPEDFELFSSLVRQRSGLVLTAEKAYLLESRLFPVARKHNLKSLEDMAQVLRTKREEALMSDITEAMTTNESFFFRDTKPFTLFQTVILPNLLTARAGKKQLRIWSAAASSGQEAYSIAMICAEEAAKLRDWKIDIIGTDLSREMVTRAKAGNYTQFEVQRGLPVTYLVKYFQQIAGGKWQIKDNIRQMVQFREGNLLTDFGLAGTFDVVFCRNVLIYFDLPTKTKVLNAIAGIMPPDGYLLMGGAETVLGVSDRFKAITGQHGLYVPTASTVTVPAAAPVAAPVAAPAPSPAPASVAAAR
ncbi:MAG: protein-glutamate O-methyltransferase [Alphaproteobacteria bacterium]|nr:protein-glutamate O-methyltransferase [Alphaproteobacteria bacterium]